MIDFDAINARLLSDYLGTLKQWLPNGKKIGAYWCAGSLSGEPGESLKIHARKGVWSDFATGEKGGDPVSLYAAIHGIGQGRRARHGTPTEMLRETCWGSSAASTLRAGRS